MTPFGERIRQLRAERHISQKKMAKDLGVSAAYLSALEHGKRGMPNYAMLQNILTYMNIIWDEADELVALALLSNPRILINTSELSPNAMILANRLAREISKLPEETILAMLDFLNKPTSTL